MLSSRILLAAAISAWLAIPAGAQTPPGNAPPPAAPSNVPGPTPPARTNPATPAPARAHPDRSRVPPLGERRPKPVRPGGRPSAPGTGAATATTPVGPRRRRRQARRHCADRALPTDGRMRRPVAAGIWPLPLLEKQADLGVRRRPTYIHQTRPSLPRRTRGAYDAAAERAAAQRLRSLGRPTPRTAIEVTTTRSDGVSGKMINYDTKSGADSKSSITTAASVSRTRSTRREGRKLTIA